MGQQLEQIVGSGEFSIYDRHTESMFVTRIDPVEREHLQMKMKKERMAAMA